MTLPSQRKHYRKKVRREDRGWFYKPPSTTIRVDPDWQSMRANGDKEWYSAYLKTAHWHELRRRVFERDGYRCTRCPNKTRLEAHHLTYERLGRELLTDLTTLCFDCHRQIHKEGAKGY